MEYEIYMKNGAWKKRKKANICNEWCYGFKLIDIVSEKNAKLCLIFATVQELKFYITVATHWVARSDSLQSIRRHKIDTKLQHNETVVL